MTSLFLSLDNNLVSPLNVACRASTVCCWYNICANVTPLYSSVHVKAKSRFRTEPGVRLDILDASGGDSFILRLWCALREQFDIHCVWLDRGDFHGCICEWPYYKLNWKQVGPSVANHPLTCSEY